MINFQKIPEIEEVEELKGSDFTFGYMFLMGESMIKQKYKKRPGDEVTIYKIIRNDENGIMYIPEYYLIEKGE